MLVALLHGGQLCLIALDFESAYAGPVAMTLTVGVHFGPP